LQLSFRAKLISIVVATTVAFAAVLAVGAFVGHRQVQDLGDVEGRMVPKLELGPRLKSQFEHLRQGMHDAVAAQDPAALDDSIRQRNELLRTVSAAGAALRAEDAAMLRHSITAYHQAAYEASRRLLRGESGESMVDALAAMQVQQRTMEGLIDSTAKLDKRELASGFDAVRKGVTNGTRYGLVIGVLAVLPVLLLSSWVGRGVFRTLGDMSSGMSRFATGNFDTAIPVTSEDELGQLAREANQMAASLRRADWIKAGRVALTEELRGELEPNEVAERALAFLCERVGAVGGVLYVAADGSLRPLAQRAGSADALDRGRAFRSGEGLPGQAALRDEITLITDPPDGYFTVRSGLGESSPRSLAFLPLARGERRMGVFELALFDPLSDDARELYASVSETIAIALDVADSRAKLRDLLEESQRMTEQLTAQEEELRANNRELSEQQEELKRANEELEQQRHALSNQNAEMIRAREGLLEKAHELAQVSSYKSQFLANMSHELRTPLNSMLLLSHLLAENEGRNLTAKQVEFAKTIHGAGTDLLDLINQVLDLAKIESGRQDIVLEDVPIRELFDRLARLFRPTAHSKGLRFELEIADGLPEVVTTDRQRLERILVNLIGNALKFTELGAVTLHAYRPRAEDASASSGVTSAGRIALSVSDTGIGIPRAAQERIFAPFEQADAGVQRRYSGTGLGLAIARESALLLGGDLVVESTVGVGSTFTCYVPLRPPAGAGEPTVHTAGASAPPSSKNAPVADDRDSVIPGEAYLLVVEDDSVFAEQLVELIRGRRLKAVVVSSGSEALRIARLKRPRGIILDVNLPDTDGWSVMEELKRDPATRSVPVHFISGADAPERAMSLGAVGYLRKPASKREVVEAIRTLMRPSAVDTSRVLVVEDDPTHGGSIVQLLATVGLAAEHVSSAGDALEALAKERFGCVVLDLGLPDMDGLGLLEKLRTHPVMVMPPVVVHTGRTLTREETRRIEAYAEAVVLKDGNAAERLVDEVRLFVQHVNAESDGSRPETASEPLPDVSLEGIRILLADDDMRTAYALSALLRGKGAEVIVAETGKEALERLRAGPDVSLILMDMMMPEMDGYEALRNLRADPRFAHVPAIALTAKVMKDERERCLAAGASDYLAKPVTPARLLTTVREWVQTKARNGS
jgi:CheY-like chemotaxis protein/signal transduction histidine kinase/HAMP domain-containing protein